MRKEEYLAELSKRLRRLPRREYEEAMSYYREYFAEAGPEMEQQVMHDLGTPQEAARQIIRNTVCEKMNEPTAHTRKRNGSLLWMIILGIFALPIAIPVAISLVAVLFAIVLCGACLWLCGIAAFLMLAGGGAAAVVGGIIASASYPASGLANIGMGILCIGFGLLTLLLVLCTGRGLWAAVRKLFSKILGGHKA